MARKEPHQLHLLVGARPREDVVQVGPRSSLVRSDATFTQCCSPP